LATVTFLDERADITGPDAAVPAAGQTRNVNVLSAVSQSTTCRVAPTRSPASAVS
jgi:stage III sporulation protein SpoIIIAA